MFKRLFFRFMIRYYQRHPDIFIEDMFNIKLLKSQKDLIKNNNTK